MTSLLNNYDEDVLVKLILSGLNQVLRIKRIDKKYINETKVHKIVYNVAERLNLDNITRSWYMRGCYIWCNDPIEAFLSGKDINSINTIISSIPKDIAKTIVNTIKSVIEELGVFRLKSEGYHFLEEIYRRFAPSEFRDLYITNLKFKKSFESFIEQLYPNKRLYFVDVDSTIVSESLSELHMAISKTIEDHRIVNVFIEYTTLLETIALGIEEKARNNEVTEKLIEFCKEAYVYYDNEVWKLPATEIAKRTIKGQNSRNVLQNLQRNFNITLNNVKVYLKIYEKRIDELELNPSEDFLLERIESSLPAKEFLKALRDI
ncbi:hypothetical protein [Archaeoglobus profundus]|uniref:DUF8098 domain-containing protein n=1 Tax=Archaeoglobus profundus (strain DSM 5631 / JCM 9629 / NBRC 100127 / Av18) TaxID=572546 RepID=D2RF43_ARCPA|nr:hypothetical protein [Archaeoglobus profundus]ADB58737.1 hypothetical protein Arcpr_1691 [Archaeoglobus profundus DSM 5631]